jgi:hypothetical protein
VPHSELAAVEVEVTPAQTEYLSLPQAEHGQAPAHPVVSVGGCGKQTADLLLRIGLECGRGVPRCRGAASRVAGHVATLDGGVERGVQGALGVRHRPGTSARQAEDVGVDALHVAGGQVLQPDPADTGAGDVLEVRAVAGDGVGSQPGTDPPGQPGLKPRVESCPVIPGHCSGLPRLLQCRDLASHLGLCGTADMLAPPLAADRVDAQVDPAFPPGAAAAAVDRGAALRSAAHPGSSRTGRELATTGYHVATTARNARFQNDQLPALSGAYNPTNPGAPAAEDRGFEPLRVVNPTRFPIVRPRPLGESSAGQDTQPRETAGALGSRASRRRGGGDDGDTPTNATRGSPRPAEHPLRRSGTTDGGRGRTNRRHTSR